MGKALTDQEKSFLKLVVRSPDIGDGWRQVSQLLWAFVTGFSRPELLETEESIEGGCRVRLSERGAIVCDYI